MNLTKKILFSILLFSTTAQLICEGSLWSRFINYLYSWNDSALATAASSTGAWIKQNPGKTTLAIGGLTAAGVACYLYGKSCQLLEPKETINQFVAEGKLIPLENGDYDFSDTIKQHPKTIGTMIIKPIISAIKVEQQKKGNNQFSEERLSNIWKSMDHILSMEDDLTILKNMLNQIIKKEDPSPSDIMSIIREAIKSENPSEVIAKLSLKLQNSQSNEPNFDPKTIDGKNNIQQLLYTAEYKIKNPSQEIQKLTSALNVLFASFDVVNANKENSQVIKDLVVIQANKITKTSNQLFAKLLPDKGKEEEE